ncbi:MAG: four helix bundle protein [Proteobacteria bacterium]|nr:four helix bundle protein [Pseudomonadota bacterium]
MKSEEFKKRTKRFGLAVIQLTDSLPQKRAADVIGRQLLRSGTSVGANYRAACRARSRSDFISKMKVVEEEADESMYWMELLEEAGIKDKSELKVIMKEAEEILAIVVASIRTARKGP